MGRKYSLADMSVGSAIANLTSEPITVVVV